MSFLPTSWDIWREDELPEAWKRVPTPSEIESAARKLQLDPSEVQYVVAFALPDYPIVCAYVGWDHRQSSAGVVQPIIHNREDFEREFGRHAIAETLTALLNG